MVLIHACGGSNPSSPTYKRKQEHSKSVPVFFCIGNVEGFEPAEAKQVDIQQNGNAACVDGCDHRSIQLCRGQGVSLRRQASDA